MDQAFDPAANVAYAAKFLIHLRAQRRSWQKAVRFYHSSDPVRQRHYGNKVTKARQQIRLRDAEQRRNARIALAKARRNPQETTQKADAPPTVRGILLSSWPPRSYRAQRQLELRARNWAFNKRRH